MKDFIKKVEGYPIPAQVVSATMDVVLLYTNIPHEEAHSVIEETLKLREIKKHLPILLWN